MFKKLKKTLPETKSSTPDDTFEGLPRGVEGRKYHENCLPHSYFETPENLAQIDFTEHSGENFLGIVQGITEWVINKDGSRERVTKGGKPIGIKDDRHRIAYAGSRSGKGRSIIIPELLTYGGSMVIIDPKGENSAVTSRYRAENLGQKVHIVDPFKITPDHCAEYRSQYNPLTLININNKRAIEDAGLIADALVVSHDPKDAFWTDSARDWIEAVILYVAVSDDFSDDERNLLTVAELILGKKHNGLKGLVKDMENESALDGRISAPAYALKEKADQERGSIISTARKNIKFLNYDAFCNALGHNDFDLEELKGDQPMTVYLVLPTMMMGTCKQFLRLFVNMTLIAIERNIKKPNVPVQLIIDEAATLGKLDQLEIAIGQIAGFGLRITTIWQDISQTKSIYKDRFETFIGNSGIMQFFGIVDAETSKWVSNYLGKTTIRHAEQNTTSMQDKQNGRSGLNYRTQTVDLMTAEEVRSVFARNDYYNRQLVLIPGQRPWILSRANYDQHEIFEGRHDEW